ESAGPPSAATASFGCFANNPRTIRAACSSPECSPATINKSAPRSRGAGKLEPGVLMGGAGSPSRPEFQGPSVNQIPGRLGEPALPSRCVGRGSFLPRADLLGDRDRDLE